MTREQFEDAANCVNLMCDKCSVNTAPGNCMPRVAAAALEIIDKLERAKQLIKERDMCGTCKYYQDDQIDNLPCGHVCVRCLRLKSGDLWEFNENLLEGVE